MDIIEIANQLETLKGIYGFMYGHPYINDGHNSRDKIIFIPAKNLQLTSNPNGYAFFYQWGWPGPDWNIYNFSDYNKTWSFNKEELEQIFNKGNEE